MAGNYAELAIVVGYDATTLDPVVMTSPDGITWTEATGFPGGTDTVAVAGDTYFIGTGAGADNLATSGDGASWALQSAPFAGARIAWTGTRWVAVDGNTSYTSTTATSWTSGGATGSTHSSRRVLHAGGVIVSTGLGGGGIAPTVVFSTDEGATWSTYTPPANTNEGQDLAYGAGRWVIPRRRTSGGDPADIGVITSTDGTTWSVINTGIALNNGWYHAAYGNGIFLLVGVTNTGAPAVATSTTGAANSFGVFTPTGLPSFPSQAGRLTFWAGRFLYIDVNSGVIYDSTNGTTWTSTTFTNRVWTDIAAGVARPLGGIYRDGRVHLS